MNTTEKIIIGILVVCLLGWLMHSQNEARKLMKQQRDQQAAQNQGSGKDKNGKTDVAKVKPDTPAAARKVEPAAPTPKPVKEEIATAPEAAAPLAEFANLKPAEPVALKVTENHDGTESPLVDYVIDPQKGGIVKATLYKHKKCLESDERMTIGSDEYPILSFDGTKPFKFTNAKILGRTDTSVTIARQIIGTSLVVKQTWTVLPGQYRLKYRLVLENRGTERTPISNPRLLTGVMEPESPPKGMFGASGMDQVARFYPTNDNESDYEMITKIVKFGDKKKKHYQGLQYHWVSVENKFFVTVCRGVQPDADPDAAKKPAVLMQGVTFATPVIPTSEPENKKKPKRELIAYVGLPDLARIQPGGVVVKDYEMYLGPKIYSKLKEMGHQQEEIMGFGRLIYPTFTFMRWIALGIYNLIVWLGGAVGNYGVAIILATIMIRFLLMPITYRSSVWSQRMKEIQPKMQEIKEKYGHDQQKVGQMTMALYKEHKINPLGGCLPIFVQMPVFFALFNVLRSAIELRHAAFFGWIKDLSQPDMLWFFPSTWPIVGDIPLNVLPFLMAGGTYLQQKTMPTSADPMQQKMMGFMTIFILFVCYSMPSGLTLYWTVGTVCSVIQFRVTQMLLAKEGSAKETKGKNEKKK